MLESALMDEEIRKAFDEMHRRLDYVESVLHEYVLNNKVITDVRSLFTDEDLEFFADCIKIAEEEYSGTSCDIVPKIEAFKKKFPGWFRC